MRQSKIEKIYKILPIISLIVLAICFIFRYSYVDIFGFDRPLKFAVFFCTSAGIIATLLVLIDGVNKYFNSEVIKFLFINLVFVFTFPLLNVAEQFSKANENPYESLVPETSYTTKNRDDAAFILEGMLYEWPLTLGDFIKNGYDYRQTDEGLYSISKAGKSSQIKPTWFTDGERNLPVFEAYELNLKLDGKGELETQNVDKLIIKALDNNWDFQIQGYTLIDDIYKMEEKYGDKLVADPNNNEKTIKDYYLKTSDGYLITFGAFRGKIQVVTIEKE